jgi:hypothetical protein
MNPIAATSEKLFSPCTIGNICMSCSSVPSLSSSADANLASGSLMSAVSGGTNTPCLVDSTKPHARPLLSLQQCGNGIVEGDEECDPGSSAQFGNNTASGCCDAATCRLRAGAACDPDADACCTDTCALAPQGQVCRVARPGGCDVEEVCSGSAGACPVDVTKPNGEVSSHFLFSLLDWDFGRLTNDVRHVVRRRRASMCEWPVHLAEQCVNVPLRLPSIQH